MIKEGMYAKLRAATKDAGPNALPPLTPDDKREGERKWSQIIDKNFEDEEVLKKRLRRLQAFSDSRVKMKMKK